MTPRSQVRHFKTSPEGIRLAARMYVRYLLLRRNVEDLPHQRGIKVSYETVRFRWYRFGPLALGETRWKLIRK